MTTLTPQQQEEVAKLDDYIKLKEIQLNAYKDKMALLAKEVKDLTQKIKEIESYA